MISELKKQFLELFGGSDEGIRVFSSPGRVNLIGEHTDYNGGYVFPAALTMATTIIARPRQDSIVRMAATDLDGIVEGNLDTIDNYKDLSWGNYQFGVFDELRKAGYNICGADMLYHDTTPHGGGLSSSAAIEISAAIAMAALGGATDIDNIEMAKISQLAEHNYIGVNCGIMDQFASAMGKKNHLIFLDCKTLDYHLVPIQLDGYKLVISNTNLSLLPLEVMASNSVAVCSVGDNSTWLVNDENSVLVDYEPIKMAEKMAYYFEHPDELAEIRKKGLEFANATSWITEAENVRDALLKGIREDDKE